MKTLKANVGHSSERAVKHNFPVKQWAVMTWFEQWTYSWHVAVMLCTFGFVFPNALIS